MRVFPDRINFKEPANTAKLFEQSVDSFFKVFNASPGGMCLTDNSILVEINHSFESLFGYDRRQSIGKNNFSLVVADSAELRRVGKIIETNGNLYNEAVTCRHRNGHTIYVLVTILSITLSGRQLSLITFNDVSKIKEQSNIITGQHNDILDSIAYTKRIQEALFPSKALIDKMLPECFILLKPKATVTSDFYWIGKKGDKLYVAAADCTGQGVPGALMSIIGYNLLSTSVKEDGSSRPCDILNELGLGVYKMLRQNADSWGAKDGMEISVISLDKKNNVLEFASARQPVYRVRNNELLKLLPDRYPIGILTGHHLHEFNNQQIQVEHGDAIYLFTDGYTDQFGGPEKKKFKSLQFQKLLMSIHHLSMEEQKFILDKKIEEWKGADEQIDDILIIGIRI